jgi:hypothetical protein
MALALASATACASDPATSDTKSSSTRDEDEDDGDTAAAKVIECEGDAEEGANNLIADFDDAVYTLNGASDLGFMGGFYVFNDEKDDSPDRHALEAAAIDRCSDESSSHAVCMKADAFMTWGGGMGTDLKSAAGEKEAVDLSEYSGISFYVMRRGGNVAQIKVGIPEKSTAVDGGICSDEAGTEQCDPYNKMVPVSTTWKKHTVLFEDLKQGGWGMAADSFDPSAVYAFQVQADKGFDIDVCIDQIELVE